MDNFENMDREEELRQEYQPEPAQEQPASAPSEPVAEQPYSNAGVGRKESPFANSPYVMEHQPQFNAGCYYTEPPKKAKKVKKEKKQRKPMGKVIKGAIAAVLIIRKRNRSL